MLPVIRHKDNVATRLAASLVVFTFLMAGTANCQDFSPCGVPELPSAAKDFVPIGLLAKSGAPASKIDPVSAELDNLYRNVPNEGAAGVAVLAVQNGKVLFKRAYGFADIQTHLPLTTSSRLGIGSITKQFTAAAILKLQEQGKLALEDRLSK